MTPTAIPRITDEFGSINDVGWYDFFPLIISLSLNNRLQVW
jgi:hypothetical protein